MPLPFVAGYGGVLMLCLLNDATQIISGWLALKGWFGLGVRGKMLDKQAVPTQMLKNLVLVALSAHKPCQNFSTGPFLGEAFSSFHP